MKRILAHFASLGDWRSVLVILIASVALVLLRVVVSVGNRISRRASLRLDVVIVVVVLVFLFAVIVRFATVG